MLRPRCLTCALLLGFCRVEGAHQTPDFPHSKIKRTVEITATGYKSRTVSDDPDIARTLQKHVKEMRGRLGAGMMIRRWDPAFAQPHPPTTP